MMLYGVMDLGQHWFKLWFTACRPFRLMFTVLMYDFFVKAYTLRVYSKLLQIHQIVCFHSRSMHDTHSATFLRPHTHMPHRFGNFNQYDSGNQSKGLWECLRRLDTDRVSHGIGRVHTVISCSIFNSLWPCDAIWRQRWFNTSSSNDFFLTAPYP